MFSCNVKVFKRHLSLLLAKDGVCFLKNIFSMEALRCVCCRVQVQLHHVEVSLLLASNDPCSSTLIRTQR